MSKKNESNENTKAQELQDEELKNVSGGGSFLEGSVTQLRLGGATFDGGGNLAAKSQTTLDCWDQCTVYISGC